jgi:glycosyltransferase involved in cell wall biosynthesis
MSANTVSVIIPSYNAAKFLPEAIESVLAQTYPAFEIIVVDDGSTDNTGEVAARYSGVRYIRQENQGLARVRSRGVRESRGDYLVFLDHDDRLFPNALQIGVNGLDAHPNCAFAFGICKLIAADGLPLESGSSILETPFETFNYQSLLRGRCLVPPATVMFRRSVFESIGEFDADLAPVDDYDMYLRIARAFPIYCHNQVVAEYRQHPNSLTATGKTSRILELNLRTLDKQWNCIKGNRDDEQAYRSGKKHFRNLFGPYLAYEVVAHAKARRLIPAVQAMLFLLQYYPQGFPKYAAELLSKLTQRFKKSAIYNASAEQ